jgi:hypothetical protein
MAEDCGRDAHYWAPPAQIRTCGIPAYGSYREWMTPGRCERPHVGGRALGTQRSRRRVRAVRCTSAFLAIPPLPSIDSATSKPVLFADFVGTTSESDFSGSCIIGFGSSPSRCGPSAHTATGGQAGDLPVPAQGACVHARFFDHAGSSARLRWRTQTYGLPLHRQRRHPELVFFRGSMAGLHVPLPTLRRHPHECLRTA